MKDDKDALDKTQDEFKENLHVEMGDVLKDEMSDISEHAIQGEQEKEKETAEKALEGFDSEIHAMRDGKPIPTIRHGKVVPGKFQLKRGKKKGTPQKAASVVSGDSMVSPGEIVNNGGQAAGKAAAHMLITLGCTIGGDEFQPVKDETYGIDEAANLETAFGDYFVATGRTDFPPGIALSIAVGGYILPRFTRPKTKSRLEKAGEWLYLKFRGLKKRKKPETPEPQKEVEK